MKTLAEAKKMIEQLEAEKLEMQSTVDQLQADLANFEAVQAEQVAKQEQLEAANSALQIELGQVAESLQSKETELESVKAEAVQAAASIGVQEPVAGESQSTAKDADEIKAEFASIKDPTEKSKFYQANRDLLNPFKR